MEASTVREILPLPALTPLEQTPDYIVGVADVRGQIMPVMDLNRRFGHLPQRRRLDDRLVVLEREDLVVSLLVNEVLTVRDLTPEVISPVPAYGSESSSDFSDARFLTGLAKSGDQIVMLLHLESLLRLSPEWQPERQQEEVAQATEPSASLTSLNAFCDEATPQERSVFLERARDLAQTHLGQEDIGLLPLAVVRLGEEFFGIALPAVREFADLHSVTPVPCCPPHIVGQMNLRGDLLTVVDIAGTLGLPAASGRSGHKVIVMQSRELGAAVRVDEILDVLYLRATDVLPAVATDRVRGQEYLRGVVAHGARMLSLLDLPALLNQPSLFVNEKP